MESAAVLLAGIDWGGVTAWATVALNGGVIVAILSVRQDRRAADRSTAATREATEQAKQAAIEAREDAQRQLQASYRPLLIEVLRNGPVTTDMEARGARHLHATIAPPEVDIPIGDGEWGTIDPREIYVSFDGRVGVVSVPLRNVGQGLAVLNSATVCTSAPVDPMHITIDRSRVPPGETTRITILGAPNEHADDARGFSITVCYSDFKENQSIAADVYVKDVGEADWRVDYIKQRICQ